MGWKLFSRRRTRFLLWTVSWSWLRGVTSVGTRLGPFSRSSRRPGVTRVDLPGGFHALHTDDNGPRHRRGRP